MAYGQIDPARLNSDALTRWYLRSPADIEHERRKAAGQAYDSFFSQPDDSTPANDEPASTDEASSRPNATTSGAPVGDSEWAVESGFGGQQFPAVSGLASTKSYRLAAATGPRSLGDYWSIPGCANCHGYTPSTLPPVGGHSPFPPTYSPRTGGSDGSSSARPEWSDKPQCNQQFERDREICQAAKNYKCWENQNKRLAHCSPTGEVGIPKLGFGPPGR